MGGVIPDDDAEDMRRILNGRLTQAEYVAANPARRQVEDSKGDMTFTQQDASKLAEDLWYVLNEKLEGAEVRGKLKGLADGEGLAAYQKIFKWYSAVTGATLSQKMSQAMHPDSPKKVKEVSAKLEEWSALVETPANVHAVKADEAFVPNGYLHASPADQSSCAHLDDVMRDASTAASDRAFSRDSLPEMQRSPTSSHLIG